MKHQYNYFYKITNTINNHFYYGVHCTSNLNDGYMGSGKRLQYAIKKYGIENFKKEILKYFDTSKDAYNYEAEVVSEELVLDINCYNLKLGGEGGWLHAPLSEATKKKISTSNSENHLGEKNPNYGNKWIHNLELKQSKCVPINMLNEYLNNGWKTGRVLNFNKTKKPSIREENKKKLIKQIRLLYNDYKKYGIKETMKIHNYTKSYVNLIGLFKKYIPEYIPNDCNRWKNKSNTSFENL